MNPVYLCQREIACSYRPLSVQRALELFLEFQATSNFERVFSKASTLERSLDPSDLAILSFVSISAFSFVKVLICCLRRVTPDLNPLISSDSIFSSNHEIFGWIDAASSLGSRDGVPRNFFRLESSESFKLTLTDILFCSSELPKTDQPSYFSYRLTSMLYLTIRQN